MIDRKLIDGHPVSKLAAGLLKESGDDLTPMLALVSEYLEPLRPNRRPGNNYLPDMQEMVSELARQPQAKVAELFTDDLETLEYDLEQEPNRWPVLKEHLDALYQRLKELSPSAVAAALADNLFQNLRLSYPSFGPLSS